MSWPRFPSSVPITNSILSTVWSSFFYPSDLFVPWVDSESVRVTLFPHSLTPHPSGHFFRQVTQVLLRLPPLLRQFTTSPTPSSRDFLRKLGRVSIQRSIAPLTSRLPHHSYLTHSVPQWFTDPSFFCSHPHTYLLKQTLAFHFKSLHTNFIHQVLHSGVYYVFSQFFYRISCNLNSTHDFLLTRDRPTSRHLPSKSVRKRSTIVRPLGVPSLDSNSPSRETWLMSSAVASHPGPRQTEVPGDYQPSFNLLSIVDSRILYV